MYQSTICILLFFTLFMFNLYGDIENSYKKEYSQVVSSSLINRILMEVSEVENDFANDGNHNILSNTTISIIFK